LPLAHWSLNSSSGSLTLLASVAEDVSLRVGLYGAIQEGDIFAVREASLEFETTALRPRSEFIILTLTASIGLTGSARLDVGGGVLPFRLAEAARPREISSWLQSAEI